MRVTQTSGKRCHPCDSRPSCGNRPRANCRSGSFALVDPSRFDRKTGWIVRKAPHLKTCGFEKAALPLVSGQKAADFSPPIPPQLANCQYPPSAVLPSRMRREAIGGSTLKAGIASLPVIGGQPLPHPCLCRVSARGSVARFSLSPCSGIRAVGSPRLGRGEVPAGLFRSTGPAPGDPSSSDTETAVAPRQGQDREKTAAGNAVRMRRYVESGSVPEVQSNGYVTRGWSRSG